MAESSEYEKFEQLVRAIDPRSKLLRKWELKGGVSAQVTALEIEHPDGLSQKLVVRRHGEVDLKRNPNIAEDEFKLLQILQSEGLPTPAPIHLGRSRELFSTPYIVLEYIEGKPEFAPSDLADFIRQFAVYLSRIHDVNLSKANLSFLPDQEDIYSAKLRQRPARLDESLDEGRIRDTLEPAWPFPRQNKWVLQHGDYWPGNILWKDGRLAAIIDWEDAQLGDPLMDLANSRLEILWAFGIDAMHSFTRHYESMTGINVTNLPYWDLCAALRPAFKIAEWAPDAITGRAMREGHRLFITQAFEAL